MFALQLSRLLRDREGRTKLPLEHVRVATRQSLNALCNNLSYRLSMFALQRGNPSRRIDSNNLKLPLEHVRVATVIRVFETEGYGQVTA